MNTNITEQLCKAIFTDDLQSVKTIMSTKEYLNNDVNQKLLKQALELGHIDIIKQLLTDIRYDLSDCDYHFSGLGDETIKFLITRPEWVKDPIECLDYMLLCNYSSDIIELIITQYNIDKSTIELENLLYGGHVNIIMDILKTSKTIKYNSFFVDLCIHKFPSNYELVNLIIKRPEFKDSFRCRFDNPEMIKTMMIHDKLPKTNTTEYLLSNEIVKFNSIELFNLAYNKEYLSDTKFFDILCKKGKLSLFRYYNELFQDKIVINNAIYKVLKYNKENGLEILNYVKNTYYPILNFNYLYLAACKGFNTECLKVLKPLIDEKFSYAELLK